MSREAWISIGVVVGIIALVTIAGAVRLVIKLIGTRKLLGELGGGGKLAFYGALAYTIFPIDILPDPIYLDDMAVLGGALVYLTKLAAKRGLLKGGLPHGPSRPHLPAGRPGPGR